MGNCSCDILLGNAGVPGCVASHGVARKLIRTPLIATDGTQNKIDLSVALDQAAITALINQADASKRWYPTPNFKTVTQERADPIFEDFPDGSQANVRDGVKTFNGFITNGASPQLVGVLKDDKCTKFGVYIVDDFDNLIGRDIGDGYLYPIPVDNGSYNPQYIEPTDSTVAKVDLTFNFSTLFRDENIGFIAADAIGASLLSENGLLDVVITASSPVATGVSIKLEYIYGPSGSKLPVTGLDMTTAGDAEFTLVNTDTGNSTIGIDSAPEGPDGTYEIVYTVADQPAIGNIVQGTVNKNGLDKDSKNWTTT